MATEWLVAVDDDPTGCQSVSGVPVLTSWDEATLRRAALGHPAVTFVLTNSRALDAVEAMRVSEDVGRSLATVATELGLELRLISRSDSTLRGHFPVEVDALARGANWVPDAVVLAPCFLEAGRYTIEGVQWVQRQGELVAARDTEFSRDARFGYTELELRDWAKRRGSWSDDEISEIPARLLARGDTGAAASILREVPTGGLVIVNAASYSQLSVAVDAIEIVEREGRRLLYRSGPSFVRARARSAAPPVVDFGRFSASGRRAGGLIVVGSHTALTTSQVDEMLAQRPDAALVELDVAELLNGERSRYHIRSVIDRATRAMSQGVAVVMTSRRVPGGSPGAALETGRRVAEAVVSVTSAIVARCDPRWVVAKGGITSHDVLARSLGVRDAVVAGSALPGIIPVLAIGDGASAWPFLIFPGNVGGPETLAQVVSRLECRSPDAHSAE